jgi:hypothetical protein
MGALSRDRRRSIEQQMATLKVSRFEPDPLEFTMFSDVVSVLSPQPDLANSFTMDMDSLRLLRNNIAHAKTYVESPGDVRRFVDLFERLRHWIESVSEKLKVSP